MDAADLKVFEAVARLGGMSRAASELGTVQSNVTARVRQLEFDLGTSLFSRHARGVTLPPAGQRLLPYAVRVRQLLIEARQAALDNGTPKGPLSLGSLESTAAIQMAPLLVEFAAACPLVDLTLVTGTSQELVAVVLAREVEIALVCGPVSEPSLLQETAYREELVLLSAPGRQLSLQRALSRAPKIAVLRRGCSYRQRLEDILARQGRTQVPCLEFGSLEAIYAAVAAGLAVSLLPRALVEPLAESGRLALHALPAGEGWVETVILSYCEQEISSAHRAFLSLLRAQEEANQAA